MRRIHAPLTKTYSPLFSHTEENPLKSSATDIMKFIAVLYPFFSACAAGEAARFERPRINIYYGLTKCGNKVLHISLENDWRSSSRTRKPVDRRFQGPVSHHYANPTPFLSRHPFAVGSENDLDLIFSLYWPETGTILDSTSPSNARQTLDPFKLISMRNIRQVR